MPSHWRGVSVAMIRTERGAMAIGTVCVPCA